MTINSQDGTLASLSFGITFMFVSKFETHSAETFACWQMALYKTLYNIWRFPYEWETLDLSCSNAEKSFAINTQPKPTCSSPFQRLSEDNMPTESTNPNTTVPSSSKPSATTVPVFHSVMASARHGSQLTLMRLRRGTETNFSADSDFQQHYSVCQCDTLD